jgi:hypothetical protein
MERYKNISGDSGVVAYEIFDQSIKIQFKDGGIYVYSYAIPGRHAVEAMKKLAVIGAGLATYINRNVRKAYAYRIV